MVKAGRDSMCVPMCGGTENWGQWSKREYGGGVGVGVVKSGGGDRRITCRMYHMLDFVHAGCRVYAG